MFLQLRKKSKVSDWKFGSYSLDWTCVPRWLCLRRKHSKKKSTWALIVLNGYSVCVGGGGGERERSGEEEEGGREYIPPTEKWPRILFCDLWRCGCKVGGSVHKSFLCLNGGRSIGPSDEFSLNSSVNVRNIDCSQNYLFCHDILHVRIA